MDNLKQFNDFRFRLFCAGLINEVRKAESKHPWKEHTEKNICVQASILAEEAGEVAAEANKLFDEGKTDWSNIKLELLQTAAVCFRIYKNLGNTENHQNNKSEK